MFFMVMFERRNLNYMKYSKKADGTNEKEENY